MATSFELWIVKFAIEKSLSTRFYLRKLEQENFWSSGRKYKCYAEFLSEFLISKHSVPLVKKKLLFSGDIKLIPGPVETAEIPIVLTYGRRLMCSLSTYFK